MKQTDFPTAVYAIVPSRDAAIKFVAHYAPDKEEITHSNNLRKEGFIRRIFIKNILDHWIPERSLRSVEFK